ncbi:MAG TPA: MFS transporter, partial [Syntrophomonadaceae bacterium]|nr:MFS transporter [Syntrophomonadaceae bacterium]
MTLLFLLGMAEFVRNALVLSLLPLYGQTIGYSVGMIGTAISLQYLLDNAFRIPAGWLNDRRGGKWIITGGIIVSGCGLYLMYAHWNFNWFLIGAGLYGFGFAPVWPVVVAGVSARMPAARMSEALSRVFTCWLIGGGLGPVMINFIIGRSFGLAFKILLSGLLITVLIAVCGNFPP